MAFYRASNSVGGGINSGIKFPYASQTTTEDIMQYMPHIEEATEIVQTMFARSGNQAWQVATPKKAKVVFIALGDAFFIWDVTNDTVRDINNNRDGAPYIISRVATNAYISGNTSGYSSAYNMNFIVFC